MLRHAVFFLLCTRALAETTYIDCAADSTKAAYQTCKDKIKDAVSCSTLNKYAGCLHPSCCNSYTSIHEIGSMKTYIDTACNVTCASGSAPTPDVVDCESQPVSSMIADKKDLNGFEGSLTAETGCKYYQNYAALIPKACCNSQKFTAALPYMNAMLAQLKINGCQLACGQILSSAPSAPRAVFTVMALSAVIASAMVY